MTRILVVDDDESLRTTLCRILAKGGHETLDAANGREAVSLLEGSASIDLVITDLIMPESEGLELIQGLRRQHPALPIVAISGGGRVRAEDYLSLARGCGATTTLPKPFTGGELLSTVRAVLRAPNSDAS